MLATVIIPTFNHGRLLFSSVGSVLRQSVADFEIFIIGDGITEETRDVIGQLLATDKRIRYFDNPKSPRTGEAYRHLALQEASGEVVCYLSDDDLWWPNHLEVFCASLKKLDFVHSAPCWVRPENQVYCSLVDLGVPEWREWTLQGGSPLALSFCGHTMEFYRRLPYGWRSTPAGHYTDHYMWQQMLSIEGVRPGCTWLHTVIGFPASQRRDWSLERREKELLFWAKRITEDPVGLLEQIRYSISFDNFYMKKDLEMWERRKAVVPRGIINLVNRYRRKKI